MFERRLRILLVGLAVVAGTLFGRSFWLQVVRGADYAEQERRMGVRPPELTPTTRGRILDRNGVVLAVDTPCTDAAVDYRAIVDPPDPGWVKQVAVGRVKARYGADYRHAVPPADLKPLLAKAEQDVVADVGTMWATLAPLYRPTDEASVALAAADPAAALDEVRRQIVSQVEMRRQLLQATAYRKAQERAAAAAAHGWQHWLGLGGGKPTTTGPSGGPDIDAFALTTDEQRQPHVVLHALDPEAVALLGKQLDAFPGLSLRPSTHRSYPLKDVLAVTLGRVGEPTAKDLERTTAGDPRTAYEPTDAAGRAGVEAMCEPLLRGKRGRVDREAGGDGAAVAEVGFEAGRDVHLSVDADLQNRVQGLLRHVVIRDTTGALATPPDGVSMHAAAVVLDVRTNQVLAIASNPGFDVNDLESRYAALAGQTLEEPLRNRAIADAVNPGSTCKPMIGIGAISRGVIGPHDGIECRGFLWLPADPTKPDSKSTRFPHGRCWVQSEYNLAWVQEQAARYPDRYPAPVTSLAHHPVPIGNPHVGKFGNPDGWLCYADALERSCNVYFETVADRLGPVGVDRALEAFGIGRATGIGLPGEVAGGRPSQSKVLPDTPRMSNCLSGIGQGTVYATPLQIANEAATFARGGVWMRPQLLLPDDAAALDKAAPPSTNRPRDQADLHLDPEGLAQAKIGMVAVYNGTNIWTGDAAKPAWLTVAAKTGTAEVSRVREQVSDGHGGRVWQLLPPATPDGPETATPWYRAKSATDKIMTHNWYMGYAPVDRPQVAFAVLVEYGGSNGAMGAGPVAAGVLDACIKDGYLRPAADATTRPATGP